MQVKNRGRVVSILLLLVLTLPLSCTPSTSRLQSIEAEFHSKKNLYVAAHDLFVKDESLFRLSSAVNEVGIGKINDSYKSGDEWFDKSNNNIAFSEVLHAAGVTKERLSRYEELMGELDIDSMDKDGGSVFFLKESFGVLDGYYVEIIKDPKEDCGTTVSNVGEIPLKTEGEYFVNLEGEWYLHYSYSE